MCPCFAQVRYCLKTLREEMVVKNKVGQFSASLLTIVHSTSCVCFMAFPVASLTSVFHPFLADLLLFSPQPLMNGWKVGVPFKKSAPSASKGGAKSDVQVRCSGLCICSV